MNEANSSVSDNAAPVKRMLRIKSLVGQTFSRLTVIARAPSSVGTTGKVVAMWLCRCECGNEKGIYGTALRSGKTRSCGCLKDGSFNITHGKTHTKVYNTWARMIARCHNENHPRFSEWGGRGIKVCERWRHSFERFLEDMGLPPSVKHSIDRFPNNDGDYEPGNVRWTDAKQQARNTRRTLLFTINGETKCLLDWAIGCPVKYATLRYRLGKGWSIERAMTTPLRR